MFLSLRVFLATCCALKLILKGGNSSRALNRPWLAESDVSFLIFSCTPVCWYRVHNLRLNVVGWDSPRASEILFRFFCGQGKDDSRSDVPVQTMCEDNQSRSLVRVQHLLLRDVLTLVFK